MSSPSVSVLGLGLMGTAIAKAFVHAGYQTTVWNRNATKASPLESIGANVALTPADCVKASPITVAVVVSPEALQEVLSAINPSIAKGRILLDFVTGSPALTKQSISAAQRAGFDQYIHGAILAMPHQIGSPESLYFLSGAPETFSAVEPTIRALGTPEMVSSNQEESALLELVLVANLYGVATGFLQCAAMLKKTSLFQEGGIKGFVEKLWVPYIVGCANGFFADTGRQLDENDFVTRGEGAKCSQQVHALENLLLTSEELGVSGKLLKPILELFKERTAQGHGDDEISGLVQLV